MKVILVQDVSNLGVLGDQVHVKDGFARNYLIPQGKAIHASSKKSKELQHRMQFFEKLRQAAIDNANSEAAKLVTVKLETVKKAGPGGRLFGSVTNKEIAELLQEKGFEVIRRDIIPYKPIKTVGVHQVSIKLHTEVKVDIEIKVIGEFTSPVSSVNEEGQTAPDQAESVETTDSVEATESEEPAESEVTAEPSQSPESAS